MTQRTAVTTAARRITRELNSLAPHFVVAFNTDGTVADRSYGQNTDHSHLEGDLIFRSRPDAFGNRWTQRVIQTHLDGYHAARSINRPELAAELSSDWLQADEDSQERSDAATFARIWDATMAELAAESELSW